jgi:hypothetical protein
VPLIHISASPSGRMVRGTGLDHFDAETVGLSSAKGMDICPRLFIIHYTERKWEAQLE